MDQSPGLDVSADAPITGAFMRAATQPWAWAGRAENARMAQEMAKDSSNRGAFMTP